MSPQRTQRPWQGQIEPGTPVHTPAYDPGCYLCPGNSRAAGRRNPDYNNTYVFDNDFAALVPGTPVQLSNESELLLARSERGICRVMCFSPRHDLAMSNMDVASVRKVVDAWAEQYSELGALDWVNHVQIFENRGVMMGASNPHPHCQIWANESVPDIPAREEIALLEIMHASSRCVLCDYVDLEESENQRVVCSNDHFIAVVPFWAVWPYEILLLSRAHVGGIDTLGAAARHSLAKVIQQVTAKYDNLFQTPFPYSMGFHQSPCDGREHPESHLHAHFYPPLLRSATVRKFMVGYEMLAGPQRDITPEFAADHLRNASDAPLSPQDRAEDSVQLRYE